MKKTIISLTICLSVVLLSCKSDDVSNKTGLAGTWNLTSLDHIVTTNGTAAAGEGISTYAISFSENPNIADETGSITIQFDDGSVISVPGNGTYNWNLNEETLSLTEIESNFSINYTIQELTENSLVYRYNEIREQINEDGSTTITDIETTYFFSK